MPLNEIAIIGFGPRGLNVLERFLECVTTDGITERINIHIINPGIPGEGVHLSSQPDHMLVNTVSSQVTMFAGDSIALQNGGESFTQWAKTQGYKRNKNSYIKSIDGETLTDMDYLPRALLGEYLSDVYRKVRHMLPPNIQIIEHQKLAVDLTKGKYFLITLDDQTTIECDFVFLTTGHGYRKATQTDKELNDFFIQQREKNPSLRYFRSPYPVSQLDSISSQSRVLIQGFGLTAHDSISALTIGRGGYYQKHGSTLEYVASGTEPKIFLSSRQCLPFAARGINQKGLTGRHTAQFLTPAVVDSIRKRNISEQQQSQIDFRTQIMPLLMKEMAYAWRCATSQKHIEPQTFVATEQEVTQIERILWPLRNQTFDNFSAYKTFFTTLLTTDLEQALLGNMNSPLKASTDVLRDVREALRRAIEFSGLTPGSHRYFMEKFNPIINRVSFGPPLRRNQELLALMNAGIVSLGEALIRI